MLQHTTADGGCSLGRQPTQKPGHAHHSLQAPRHAQHRRARSDRGPQPVRTATAEQPTREGQHSSTDLAFLPGHDTPAARTPRPQARRAGRQQMPAALDGESTDLQPQLTTISEEQLTGQGSAAESGVERTGGTKGQQTPSQPGADCPEHQHDTAAPAWQPVQQSTSQAPAPLTASGTANIPVDTPPPPDPGTTAHTVSSSLSAAGHQQQQQQVSTPNQHPSSSNTASRPVASPPHQRRPSHNNQQGPSSGIGNNRDPTETLADTLLVDPVLWSEGRYIHQLLGTVRPDHPTLGLDHLVSVVELYWPCMSLPDVREAFSVLRACTRYWSQDVQYTQRHWTVTVLLQARLRQLLAVQAKDQLPDSSLVSDLEALVPAITHGFIWDPELCSVLLSALITAFHTTWDMCQGNGATALTSPAAASSQPAARSPGTKQQHRPQWLPLPVKTMLQLHDMLSVALSDHPVVKDPWRHVRSRDLRSPHADLRSPGQHSTPQALSSAAPQPAHMLQATALMDNEGLVMQLRQLWRLTLVWQFNALERLPISRVCGLLQGWARSSENSGSALQHAASHALSAAQRTASHALSAAQRTAPGTGPAPGDHPNMTIPTAVLWRVVRHVSNHLAPSQPEKGHSRVGRAAASPTHTTTQRSQQGDAQTISQHSSHMRTPSPAQLHAFALGLEQHLAGLLGKATNTTDVCSPQDRDVLHQLVAYLSRALHGRPAAGDVVLRLQQLLDSNSGLQVATQQHPVTTDQATSTAPAHLPPPDVANQSAVLAADTSHLQPLATPQRTGQTASAGPSADATVAHQPGVTQGQPQAAATRQGPSQAAAPTQPQQSIPVRVKMALVQRYRAADAQLREALRRLADLLEPEVAGNLGDDVTRMELLEEVAQFTSLRFEWDGSWQERPKVLGSPDPLQWSPSQVQEALRHVRGTLQLVAQRRRGHGQGSGQDSAGHLEEAAVKLLEGVITHQVPLMVGRVGHLGQLAYLCSTCLDIAHLLTSQHPPEPSATSPEEPPGDSTQQAQQTGQLLLPTSASQLLGPEGPLAAAAVGNMELLFQKPASHAASVEAGSTHAGSVGAGSTHAEVLRKGRKSQGRRPPGGGAAAGSAVRTDTATVWEVLKMLQVITKLGWQPDAAVMDGLLAACLEPETPGPDHPPSSLTQPQAEQQAQQPTHQRAKQQPQRAQQPPQQAQQRAEHARQEPSRGFTLQSANLSVQALLLKQLSDTGYLPCEAWMAQFYTLTLPHLHHLSSHSPAPPAGDSGQPSQHTIRAEAVAASNRQQQQQHDAHRHHPQQQPAGTVGHGSGHAADAGHAHARDAHSRGRPTEVADMQRTLQALANLVQAAEGLQLLQLRPPPAAWLAALASATGDVLVQATHLLPQLRQHTNESQQHRATSNPAGYNHPNRSVYHPERYMADIITGVIVMAGTLRSATSRPASTSSADSDPPPADMDDSIGSGMGGAVSIIAPDLMLRDSVMSLDLGEGAGDQTAGLGSERPGLDWENESGGDVGVGAGDSEPHNAAAVGDAAGVAGTASGMRPDQAMTRGSWPGSTWMHQVERVTPALVSVCTPGDVVWLLRRLVVQLGHRPPEAWWEGVLHALHASRLAHAPAWAVTQLLSILVQARYRPAQRWLDQVVAVTGPRLGSRFRPSQLAIVLVLLCRLRSKPGRDWLGFWYYTSLRAMSQWSLDLGTSVLVSMVHANERPKDDWLTALQRAQLDRHLASELQQLPLSDSCAWLWAWLKMQRPLPLVAVQQLLDAAVLPRLQRISWQQCCSLLHSVGQHIQRHPGSPTSAVLQSQFTQVLEHTPHLLARLRVASQQPAPPHAASQQLAPQHAWGLVLVLHSVVSAGVAPTTAWLDLWLEAITHVLPGVGEVELRALLVTMCDSIGSAPGLRSVTGSDGVLRPSQETVTALVLQLRQHRLIAGLPVPEPAAGKLNLRGSESGSSGDSTQAARLALQHARQHRAEQLRQRDAATGPRPAQPVPQQPAAKVPAARAVAAAGSSTAGPSAPGLSRPLRPAVQTPADNSVSVSGPGAMLTPKLHRPVLPVCPDSAVGADSGASSPGVPPPGAAGSTRRVQLLRRPMRVPDPPPLMRTIITAPQPPRSSTQQHRPTYLLINPAIISRYAQRQRQRRLRGGQLLVLRVGGQAARSRTPWQRFRRMLRRRAWLVMRKMRTRLQELELCLQQAGYVLPPPRGQ